MTADRIPDISRLVPRRAAVEWHDEQGRVTVVKQRKAGARKAILKLFGVPGSLKIHLDPLGSEVWRSIDGARDVAAIKALLHAKFPDETQLPNRLGTFFSIMVSKGLVEL
jgi:hypothetical protein